jgi:hypothetical protein
MAAASSSQMVVMAPMQQDFGMGLQALPAGLPDQPGSIQPPVQYSMGSTVGDLLQAVTLYANSTDAAWSKKLGTAADFEDSEFESENFDDPEPATERWSLTHQPEEWQRETETWSLVQEPEEWQMESYTNPDVDGVSRSTLRRRRRQRASARVHEEAAAAGELDTNFIPPQPEEQAHELVMQVRAGGEAQRRAVTRFRRLAFSSQESSRVAQLALEDASPSEALVLLESLHGHVRDATKSMYCNYVLQRAIELLPSESISFITRELLGVGGDVARHRFGCRILCRLLEHDDLEEASTYALFEEVLRDVDELSRHAFGNFVIRHCLEFGLSWHRHAIAFPLSRSLIETAMDQNGSHVVESVAEFCDSTDTELLAGVLLADPEQLHNLATHNYGRHAVKAFLRRSGQWQNHIADILRPAIHSLRESRQGKPVLQALQAFESKQ